VKQTAGQKHISANPQLLLNVLHWLSGLLDPADLDTGRQVVNLFDKSGDRSRVPGVGSRELIRH
jgi:hypothetical protein